MYLPVTSTALLEVLVTKQVSCKRSHGLHISGCDFIQILKLLQKTTTTVNCVFSKMFRHTSQILILKWKSVIQD